MMFFHRRVMWSRENDVCGITGCLHESGLSFSPDRTHSVSVEIIGD